MGREQDETGPAWADPAWVEETRVMLTELSERLRQPLPGDRCFDCLRSRTLPASIELGSLAVAVASAAAVRDQGPGIAEHLDPPGPRD